MPLPTWWAVSLLSPEGWEAGFCPLRHRSCWWLELGSSIWRVKELTSNAYKWPQNFNSPFLSVCFSGGGKSGFIILHVLKATQRCKIIGGVGRGGWTARVGGCTSLQDSSPSCPWSGVRGHFLRSTGSIPHPISLIPFCWGMGEE